MTTKQNSNVNINLLKEFTLEYLKENEKLIDFVKKETEKQLRIGGVSGSVFEVGDKVWYKNKLRKIIEIKNEQVILYDYYSRKNLKKFASINDLSHYR